MGLFDKSKVKTTKSKKDKKLVQIDDDKFDQELKTAAKLDKEIKNLTSIFNMSKSYLKEVSLAKWKEFFNNEKINVGSFNLTSKNGHRFQFVPTSKFPKLSEDEYNEMCDKYGEENLVEDITYSFNTDVLMRNMEVIEKLIMSTSEISDEDKENLIVPNITRTFDSNILNKIPIIKKEKGVDVDEIINDVNPVVQLKLFKL